MHRYHCHRLFSFLALMAPHALGSRVQFSVQNKDAKYGSDDLSPCLCDRCKNDALWFDFKTANKDSCHLSRHGYGWWCRADSQTASCTCSERQLSLRYGHWIPCGEGSGHLAKLVATASQYEEYAGDARAEFVKKAQMFVMMYKKEQNVAEEINDRSLSASLKEVDGLVNMLVQQRITSAESLVDMLKLPEMHNIFEQETRLRATVRASARLEEERRVVEEVKSLLLNEVREMHRSTDQFHDIAGRSELVRAMDVCRYNLDQYYARSAQMKKREPRDFIEQGDPCQSYGGGRHEKVTRSGTAPSALAELMEVCKQRDIAMFELMSLLQEHAQLIPGKGKYSNGIVEEAIAAMKRAYTEGQSASPFQRQLDAEMRKESRKARLRKQRPRFIHTHVLGLCRAFVTAASDFSA